MPGPICQALFRQYTFLLQAVCLLHTHKHTNRSAHIATMQFSSICQGYACYPTGFLIDVKVTSTLTLDVHVKSAPHLLTSYFANAKLYAGGLYNLGYATNKAFMSFKAASISNTRHNKIQQLIAEQGISIHT